jgi:hypothetical protein
MDQGRDLVPGQDLTAEVSGPNPTQSRGPDLVKMRRKNPKRNPKEVTDRIRNQEKIDPDQDPEEETSGRIQNPKERIDHDPNLSKEKTGQLKKNLMTVEAKLKTLKCPLKRDHKKKVWKSMNLVSWRFKNTEILRLKC